MTVTETTKQKQTCYSFVKLIIKHTILDRTYFKQDLDSIERL